MSRELPYDPEAHALLVKIFGEMPRECRETPPLPCGCCGACGCYCPMDEPKDDLA